MMSVLTALQSLERIMWLETSRTYLLAKWALPFSEAAKNKVVIYCCTFVNLTMYFSKIPQHIAFMVLYKMEGQVLSFYFFLPPPKSLKQI